MPKKYFAKYRKPLIDLPLLSEVQLRSYEWFFKKGLRELFNEISPLTDYTNKELSLEFLEYYLDEPKYAEPEAKSRNLSFEAALRVRAKLTNKRTGEVKEQEIYLGDFPIMTPRGTFVVNGVERVVVSQLIRSSGVYFTRNQTRGKSTYGAKIIPNRGAWLEFETESDNTIIAKIDRRRKIPVSSLLRVFGMSDTEAIRETFKDIDTGENSYMKRTLEKDTAQNRDEAYIEVYKRIRPGDLATVDNARTLIDSMFSFERYDLAEVGRYKFNQRLGLAKDASKDENRVLGLDDLIAVITEIIRMNNRQDVPGDDIDALGNRRVRGVGELMQQKLRIGIARMARIVRDRMSTLDIYTLTPAQLINARPFIASLKEFFTSSQLSQFMDQINPLSELEHERRLSALGPGGLARERAGFEVRDVHPTHYGRICPIQTPEGPNIGLVGHLASYARINDLGLIETPYVRVKNGELTGEVIYMNASAESQHTIAHASTEVREGKIIEERVECRVGGQPTLVDREKVDLMDVSSQQAISIATSLIPFLEHDDANRAMMGSNMQRQAVPVIAPELPVVSTGIEARAARDSGRVLMAPEDGEIIEVDAKRVVLKAKSGKTHEFVLNTFLRTNQNTAVRQKVRVTRGVEVKKGDVLADSSSTDHGELALGKNLTVAFISWGGSNYEDAVIINEKLVREDSFTSIHIEDHPIAVRDTKLGPEMTSADIPNVGEVALRNLDESGVVRIGAEVRSGDILVGKITPKGEADLTPEERLLRAIFGEKAKDVKDTSLRLPHGKRGRVVGIKEFSRELGDKLESGVIKQVQVEVAQLRKVSVGDKFAGRHGNKGVIARILPEEDMPYLADGTPVDIILNPLGVVSRMNIGQILETHLGWAGKTMGYQAITPALSGAEEGEIKDELRKAGLPEDGKVELFDGRTGEEFDQKVTVGCIYILKLNHLVEDKIHMRSIGPYSLITQQPLGGKAQFGGQRFGEMEVWALEGYGAAHTLQEMLTIKSDDVQGRSATYEAIINGEKIQSPNLPASFNVLVNELKGLGLDVELVEKKEELVPDPDEIRSKEFTKERVSAK